MPDTATVMPNPPSPSLKEKLTAGLKPGCPRCGSVTSWGAASWCPDCGFYPGLSPEDAVDSTAATQAQAADAHDNLPLWQRVPNWAYVLIAGEVVIFVVSLVVRMIMVDGGPELHQSGKNAAAAARQISVDQSFERSLWSLVQLGLGVICFISMHIMAFAQGVMTENFSPMDMLAHPLSIWGPSLRKLPRGAWRLWLAVWGLTAGLCSVTIIGGLQFSALFEDWGFRQRAKQNLMQKIADAARDTAGKGADKLEDSIEDFVGEATKNVPNPDDLKKKAAQKKQIECVIVGYQTASLTEGSPIQSLILAGAPERKLTCIGTLKMDGLPEKLRENLNQRLIKLHREKPFVACKMTGRWVQPVIALKIQFEDWTENNQLINPVFEEQLADLKVGKK